MNICGKKKNGSSEDAGRMENMRKERRVKEKRERQDDEGSKRKGVRMSDVALLCNLEFFLFSVSAWA